MIKVIALGDVHGQWAELWQGLRATLAADAHFAPTPQVVAGRFQVVVLGDLVHYKTPEAYALAAGVERFDPEDPTHLRRSAKAQVRELYRFKRYVEEAQGHVTVILGNHDEAALDHSYSLRSGSLVHDEFLEEKGGQPLPEDLAGWIASFPRERVFYDVHFAHAGPLPGMQHYDDFFYHDPDTKTWWRRKPWLMQQVSYRFGVYGHTVMEGGIYLDKKHRFAMIDALDKRQLLELILSNERLEYQVLQF